MSRTKSNSYETREIKSWREFDDFSPGSKQCVYRGQGSFEWDLSTGYERTKHVLNPMCEQDMLVRFMSQAGMYTSILPGRNDFVSWFSLMQHYGAGTRLLDVSRSKYIALFFAINGMIEKQKESCAVWAINTYASNLQFYNTVLKSDSTGCIDTRDIPLAVALEEYKTLGWRFANKFIVSDWEQEISNVNVDDYVEKYKDKMGVFLESGGIMEVVPQIQNARMIAQAAEFLMPITLRKTFMNNLSDGNCSPEIVKLEIKRENCGAFLEKLNDMNVTWRTVYPDISGLAKDMNW